MLNSASDAVSCEHGNEPSVSIKGREFLEQLSGYYLLKNNSSPWSCFQINKHY
jgi:hypothetical protein